jgi:hypothetical protein
VPWEYIAAAIRAVSRLSEAASKLAFVFQAGIWLGHFVKDHFGGLFYVGLITSILDRRRKPGDYSHRESSQNAGRRRSSDQWRFFEN